MNLEIKNFGKIKEAKIDLEGLTVITGQNDTGKSTIGKVLFWIINGINTYPNRSEEILKPFYEGKLSNILPYLARKNYKIPKELEKFTDNSLNSLMGQAKSLNFSDIKEAIKNTIVFIKEKNLIKEDPVIKKYYDNIEQFINFDDDSKLALTLFWDSTEIFKNNLNNSVDNETIAKIKLSLTNEEVFSFDTTKEGRIGNINCKRDKFKILWSNVDFIETPLMIDDVNSNVLKLWERKVLQKYRKKVVSKDKNDNFEIIKNLLDANILIDKNTGKLLFKKNVNSKELDMINIATGAKSFVLLDILKKIGNFETNSITIFDEPENHLHPEWQLKYAEQLVKFVKDGANIILTSHSPYMIKALKYYSVEYGLKKEQYRFLLSEKVEDNWAKINDVTDEIYKIFNLLGKPLYDIEYV